MRRKATVTAAALLAALAWAAEPPARADAPALLPVQGLLLDAAGEPVDGTRSVTFHLYDAESGGSALYSETQEVTFERGEFTVYLGAAETLPLELFRDASAHWLEVVVDGETLSPRFRLGSVPHAAFAAYCGDAATLGGQGPEAFAASSHTHAFSELSDVPAELADGDADTLGGLSCASGQLARWDGSGWACSDDRDTTYTAGEGLSLSGTTFAIDPAATQRRVSGSCTAGSSIRAIAEDGTVTCERDDDTRYLAGPGLRLVGNTFSVSTSGITSVHLAPGSVGVSELTVPHGFASRSVAMNATGTTYDVAFVTLRTTQSTTCTFTLDGTITGLDAGDPLSVGRFYAYTVGFVHPAPATNQAYVQKHGSTSSHASLTFTARLPLGTHTVRCRFAPTTPGAMNGAQANCHISFFCS